MLFGFLCLTKAVAAQEGNLPSIYVSDAIHTPLANSPLRQHPRSKPGTSHNILPLGERSMDDAVRPEDAILIPLAVVFILATLAVSCLFAHLDKRTAQREAVRGGAEAVRGGRPPGLLRGNGDGSQRSFSIDAAPMCMMLEKPPAVMEASYPSNEATPGRPAGPGPGVEMISPGSREPAADTPGSRQHLLSSQPRALARWGREAEG